MKLALLAGIGTFAYAHMEGTGFIGSLLVALIALVFGAIAASVLQRSEVARMRVKNFSR